MEYGLNETDRRRYIKRKNGEKNMFISMVFLIIGFFFSWAPYAIFCIYCMIVPDPNLNALSTFPSLFAKSTIVWTPIFILSRNRNLARSFDPRKKIDGETSLSRKISFYFI